ncbi:MAG: site-specific DNA-methyltransferase [Candidatus Kuenenbacteria bacterium]
MPQDFYSKLETILKQDSRFIDQEGDLLKSNVIDATYKADDKLVELLLSRKEFKTKFFSKVKDVLVFNINDFVAYIQDKNFLADSYTKYRNKIGLNIDGKFLNERKEVALVWPFKDCVLEGGMTKEDEKRKEIFFNEILAQDEIDKLLIPKVLTNWKKYSQKGEEKVKDLKRDDNGTIRENLIIKGNNFLALHSLKQQFQNKIKLIYIDPPYNPDSPSNTFCYNNNFNHSTWLTFMKNRLEVAKQLLTKDGALICAIDDNEFVYLGVLLREIFNDHEIHCITIVHNPRGVQGTNFSYTHEYAFFILPKGVKTVGNREIEKDNIQRSNFRNWGSESLRTDAKNCFYSIIVENDKVIGFGEVLNSKEHPKGQTIKRGNKYYVYPIDNGGIERKWRYARQSVEEVKQLLEAKKTKAGYEIEIGKDFGMYRTVWVDKRYDANEYGTKLMKSLSPKCEFDFPKSLYNVYDCLYAIIADDKDALVLDFFGGSGTTAHAVLELNKNDKGHRKFILTEQMDYVEECTVARVHQVIKNLAKDKNLFSGKEEPDFIYCELMEYNELFVDKIKKAKDTKELLKIWEEMKAKSFLNYNVDIKKFDETIDEFKKLPFAKQQRTLFDLLNKNQLYVNLSEIEDKEFKIDEDDKKMNTKFYER